MNWDYTFTPYISPMLASALLFSILGIYAWQRRAIAGALPFTIMLLFMMFWSLGATLQLAAVSLETKIFWFKLTSVMKLPAATAELCFGMQYTGLGRFLTRRNLALLSIPSLLVLVLAPTNDFHHLLWLGFSFDGVLHPLRSDLTWAIAVYSYILALAMFVIFVWMFVRAPQHRAPVALILSELLIARIAVIVDFTGINPFAPMDPVVLTWNVGALLYALALFGFRIFDPISLAHHTAIAQMRDGMLVLDAEEQVVSLNPAAQAILDTTTRRRLGRPILDLLPEYAALTGDPSTTGIDRVEISRRIGSETRYYILEASQLKDWRGLAAGRLLLLYDVTKQKQAQAQLVDQQRSLATLQERERLARELHDSIGQVLGYASFQLDAASKLVLDGQAELAVTQLDRLTEIVREAHADVREYILDLHAAPTPERPFFPALRHYLDGFTRNYNIQTVLSVDEQLGDEPFPPDASMQIFRILQEALSNARKHGQARCIQVSFFVEDRLVCMTIQDDGVGFNPRLSTVGDDGHFGLRFMRERAEALGGRLEVISQSGQGTRVVARTPIRPARASRESELNNA